MFRRTLGFASLLTLALSMVSPAASGAVTFSACAQNPGFACASLAVPLDRSGQAPGSISLSLERLQAGLTESHDAVIGLAGGPGQAANPLADFIAKAIAPALSNRDLIVFDQRGTGRSDPLNCMALESPESPESQSQTGISKLGEQCALQLGATRGAFTSEESVEDIESIRKALGYEKLVLYGTSYGTKVAELYAERYPQNVEALVLDSVVLPEGPETFSLSTFKALAPVMSELCSRQACRGITSSPLADIARLAAELHKRPLSGSVYDGSGHRHSLSIGESDLLGILQAGDLNPALRALLPAAVVSALRHDPDPLLRLYALSEGLIPNLPLPPHGSKAEREAKEEENNALFFATSCEEKPFPWQRAAPGSTREAEALSALHALPSSDFYPFDAATAWQQSLIPFCLDWPDLSPPPPPVGKLPNVPTLILSGAQDLRTPTSNARQLAAQIPDAQVEVVPYTGHSVLGSDFGSCASEAVEAFFSGVSVHECTQTTNIFSPTPLTPTSLRSVRPIPGLRGKPGRTLTAILDTMVDLSRQVIGATLQVDQELPSGSSFGGLHGGFARLTSAAVRLSHYSFVSGVELTGTFAVHDGQIRPATVKISGAAASHGTVRLGSAKSVSGTLESRHFNVSIANVKLADASAGAWPTRPLNFPLPGLVRIH
jgi:pimeloyl-ACP methyl ester carboxylesterase